MVRTISAAVLAAMVAFPAVAGEVSSRGGQTSWAPSECRMPVAPAGPFADAQSLNAAQAMLTQAVDQYNLCLRNEAERDMQRVNQAVVERTRQLQNEALALAQNFPRR